MASYTLVMKYEHSSYYSLSLSNSLTLSLSLSLSLFADSYMVELLLMSSCLLWEEFSRSFYNFMGSR